MSVADDVISLVSVAEKKFWNARLDVGVGALIIYLFVFLFTIIIP
jgi:hypothetical protein